jgi:hypothetical protein
MKDVIITLQGALLRHLRDAQEKGASLDLMALQIESEQGRVRTLVILGDLYQRLARPSRVIPTIAMSIDPNYYRSDPYGRGFPNSPDGFLPETTHYSGGYPVSSGGFFESICTSPTSPISPTEAPERTREFEPSSPPSNPNRRKSSGIGSVVSSMSDMLHSRSGRTSTSSPRSSVPEFSFLSHGAMQTVSPTEPIPDFDVRPASQRRPKSLSTIPHDEIWGNPWQHESNTESDDDLTVHLKQTHLSPVSSIPHRQSFPPSIASTDSTPSNPSTNSDPARATRPLWPPNKANNYLGFCKGAWKVHTGFGGFKIHSEPGSGYYTQRSWLRCKECAFEAPMAKSSSSNPLFDESVRIHKPSGVRYRSEFLAKSHVPCKRDSGACFSPMTPRGAFCCVFCCAAFQGPTQVFGNLETFMTHLAESHLAVGRDTLALLPSTRCVVGRVAGDSEYFDVNILAR